MDIKQKKKFLTLVFKTLSFISLCACAWTIYYGINELVQNAGILWLNITLICVAFLGLIAFFTLSNKMVKNKNLYNVGRYVFALSALTFVGIIAGIFYLYYTSSALNVGEYLTCAIVMLLQAVLVSMLCVAVKINNLNKKTSIQIDSISEVPNYDDELTLKKKLDELSRKLEMKKVAEKIEAMQKELDE